MKKNKSKHGKEELSNGHTGYLFTDPDLPEIPKLEIYKEVFGDLKNITEEWYKENRA